MGKFVATVGVIFHSGRCSVCEDGESLYRLERVSTEEGTWNGLAREVLEEPSVALPLPPRLVMEHPPISLPLAPPPCALPPDLWTFKLEILVVPF